jgi:hypothetical protein
VRIAATADIYVSFTGTAAIPGDVTDGTASELLPIRAAIIGSTFVGLPQQCDFGHHAGRNRVVLAEPWPPTTGSRKPISRAKPVSLQRRPRKKAPPDQRQGQSFREVRLW